MRSIALLSTLLAWSTAAAQNAGATPNGGAVSENFDSAKYTLPDRLLITPRTHPNLYSFTGRWLRAPLAHPNAAAFHASLWPGTSVTALFFGEHAAIKLLPQPQGKVEKYSFVVSIDGGQDVVYDAQGFDTNAVTPYGHIIPIRMDPVEPKKPSKRNANSVLRPHTIRITSLAQTPFSFEGIFVQNTQVAQGKMWSNKQDERPTFEFIGEGLDAERMGGFWRRNYTPSNGQPAENPKISLFSTVHYRLAERLGIRHYHIASNVCLLDNCDSQSTPGMQTQYFYTSPLDWGSDKYPPDAISNVNDPHHPDNIRSLYRFPAFANAPTVKVSRTNFVVVDTGSLDVLVHNQSPANYTSALTHFLLRVRHEVHPNARILVIGRQGVPPAHHTALLENPITKDLRNALFAATQQSVRDVGDPNTIFTPVTLSTIGDVQNSYLRALCPYLMPPISLLDRTKAMFGRSVAQLTNAELVCLAVDQAHRRKSGWQPYWMLLLLGACGVSLYMARETVVGAVAAVIGRRRLGLPDEEKRPGTGAIKLI